MDNSLYGSRYGSRTFNPPGTGLLDEELKPLRTSSLRHAQDTPLSTQEQVKHLLSGDLDDKLLRSILYCYDFLDTNGQEHVNPEEAESCVRAIREENPQLFGLLVDALRAESECSSAGPEIAKSVLSSGHTSGLSLTPSSKAFSHYFRNILITKKTSGNESVFNPPSGSRNACMDESQTPFEANPGGSLNRQLSGLRRESMETVFKLHSEPELDTGKAPPDPPLAQVAPNTFECVEDFKRVLGSGTNVNEYIVFNFNREFDWERSLRELC